MIVPKYIKDIDCAAVINYFHQASQNGDVFQNTKHDGRVFFSEEAFKSKLPKVLLQLQAGYKELKNNNFPDWDDLNKVILINRVTGDPHATEGSGGGYHCDSFLAFQCKLFLYLSDVEFKENGAFEYLRSPYNFIFKAIKLPTYFLFEAWSKKTAINRFDFMKFFSRHILEYFFIPLTGRAGLAWVADTRVVHRGRPNQSKASRYMLTVYFYNQDDNGYARMLQRAL